MSGGGEVVKISSNTVILIRMLLWGGGVQLLHTLGLFQDFARGGGANAKYQN